MPRSSSPVTGSVPAYTAHAACRRRQGVVTVHQAAVLLDAQRGTAERQAGAAVVGGDRLAGVARVTVTASARRPRRRTLLTVVVDSSGAAAAHASNAATATAECGVVDTDGAGDTRATAFPTDDTSSPRHPRAAFHARSSSSRAASTWYQKSMPCAWSPADSAAARR